MAMILSVDDEPTNHMVMEQMVRSQGYDFHEVCHFKDNRARLVVQIACFGEMAQFGSLGPECAIACAGMCLAVRDRGSRHGAGFRGMLQAA